MKKHKKPYLKLHIQQELAYEVISISIIIILFGIGFLFATNLLSFNWYTVLFALLFIVGLYLKRSCHLIIADDQLTVTHYKIATPLSIDMGELSEITFHEKKRQVKLQTTNGTVALIYLNMKNRQKLLNVVVQYYPTIDCIFIK